VNFKLMIKCFAMVSIFFFEIMRLYYSKTGLQSLEALPSNTVGKASVHVQAWADNGSSFA
jgi:hypothetical protein